MSPRNKEKTVKISVACCLYILHLGAMAAPAEDVTGSVNGILTLPCTYTVYKDRYVMCWGRGGCPRSKCNDKIISTDRTGVTWRKSDRYQLLGSIHQGDVSLTITGATKEDEGTYCCRVEVDGLFNDQKKEFEVKIKHAKHPTSTETPNSDTHLMTTRLTVYDTCDDSYRPVDPTTWRTSFTTQETRTRTQSTAYVITAVFGALMFVSLIGVIVYIRKYRCGVKKTPESVMAALAADGTETTENVYTLYCMLEKHEDPSD